MGQKRKRNSPEPKSSRLKRLKRVVRSRSPARERLRLSPKRRLPVTPNKPKLRRGTKQPQSPRRQSPRFKCQDTSTLTLDNNGPEIQCSCPPSSPFQSEEDTEQGLVITLDEEHLKLDKQVRKKNGRRTKTTCADSEKEAEERKEEQLERDSVSTTEEEAGEDQSDDDCGKLDRDLERKSRQHNLTAVNVRDILHEVITNEHVVAMMKTAIIETQDMPLFEPKLTRSKLKEAVEKGEPKEIKPPQFVDIPLEEDEDSSDEEYCPDEDEEDETAEDTFQESDVDSTASSPRVSRAGRARTPIAHLEGGDGQHLSPKTKSKAARHLRVAVVPMGPPPPPQSCSSPRPPGPPDCTFMEKLHAVDEELALSPICIEPYQALSNAGGAECGDNSLVACRTRSKRPLRDVPLGMLEAELHAPDITPDMYDCGSALEDRDWSEWLQGLMASDIENEEEGDDEDDPEYNFLDDQDEPDQEDYRTDRAVRITKREVNELMEELFETFQDELGCGKQDAEGREEDEERDGEPPPPAAPNFNVPQAMRFEEPLAKILTACRRTVFGQQDSPPQCKESQPRIAQNAPVPQVVLIPPPCTLYLSAAQKRQLQQQVQQHVQLLTQVNMLSAPVEALHNEAVTTKMYLSELQSFAERGEQMQATLQSGFVSTFRACNLQPSLDLLEELKNTASLLTPPAKLLRSHPAVLPPKLTWLLATRPVFLYPELLPHCSLDPSLQTAPCKVTFTKGEDGLIVLGLKHFKDTERPYHLICRYLLRNKKQENLHTHIQDLCAPRAMDSVIKDYFKHNVLPPLQKACVPVMPGEERPPVEREEVLLPHWLKKSLPHIHRAVLEYNKLLEPASTEKICISPPYVFPKGIRYPQSMPENITLHMHPLGKRHAANSRSKAKPFRAFACSSLAPLAKAPTHVTDMPRLARIQGQPPSQGIILLANAPCTPIQGAQPLATAMVTPAHGTVPINAPGPVNIQPFTQCIVQGSGCPGTGNAVINFPGSIIQIPNTGAPVFGQGALGTQMAPIGQKLIKQNPPKQTLPRKLLPIQPAPLKPAPQLPQLLSISAEHGVTVLSVRSLDAEAAPLTGEERVNGGLDTLHNPSSAMPVTRISLGSNIGGLVEPTTSSLPVSESMTDQPQDLATALLPILSTLDPSQIAPPTPPDSSTQLKTSQMFFPQNPSSPLVASTNGKASPDVPKADDGEPARNTTGESRGEFLSSPAETPTLQSTSPENKQSSGHQALSTNAISFATHQPNVPSNTAALTSTINIDSRNRLNTISQQGLVLVKSTSVGAPQFFLVPQNCLVANGPTVQSSAENCVSLAKEISKNFPSKTQESQTNSHHLRNGLQATNDEPSADASLQEVRNGMVKLIEGIKDWDQPQLQYQEEVEAEETERGQWEEEEGECPEDPLLTLSESSASPVSSLDSHSDAMERMRESEESEELESPMAEHQQEGHCHPELLTLTSGGEDKPSGESNGDGGRGREKEDGGEQQNSQGEGGSSEKDGNENGEQNGGKRSESGDQDGGGGRGGEGGDGDGEKDGDGDGDRDRPGEEDEEEDFDDLTQDEDEEEVMSSASEESVLSVPELQETMEKLTWLASERRLCGEGDSEEDNSPTSPTSPNSPVSQNSQEENSEEEEEGAVKGEEMELGDGGASKLPEGDIPQEEDGPPQASGKGAGRGRGRGRPPPRSLKRSRRPERCSKDTAKLLLLYDNHILDNDPMRESKDFAFAQAYLNRVRETLQDVPGKVEEFLGLLYDFEQSSREGESRSAVELYSQLKPVLREWPDLLRDFAAFLLPDQALECGLFEEQQAFERSRRFLRQLEISFGENPSHYQKIVRALQSGPGLSPAGREELKQQMATLLKGHTHLQGELCLFFDELRPPPARPGQFEEANWPEDDGGEGVGQGSGGGAAGGFEEVTLPDLEEEDDIHKIPPMTARNRRRKELGRHQNYKACDWPEKDCPCACHDHAHDPKLRKHRRKGCSHCHGNKASDVSKVKSPDPSVTSPTTGTPSDRGGEDAEEGKDVDTDIKDEIGSGASSPRHDQGCPTWDGSVVDLHLSTREGREEDDEDEDEEEEWREGDEENGLTPRKRIRTEESVAVGDKSPPPPSGERDSPLQPRPSPTSTSDNPVCAKNISLTPSGEKVILWTREADRVILTTCQQQGASQSTFQAISAELGNKTPSEVSRRFRDLMRLFHTSARQASSEDEASNPEHHSATDEEQD